MKDFTSLLLLPAGLLSLVLPPIVQAQEPSLPQNLPRTDENPLDHHDLAARQWVAEKKLATQRPVGVRKMSGDEGEKFFLHYWDFGESPVEYGNASIPFRAVPGMMPHSENSGLGAMIFRRGLFARDFKCPGDTHSCENSIQANICCEPGYTCISTTDGAACCPNGQTCGNAIGSCPKGYTSCDGGCCVPGSVCKGQGCLIVGTQTTTTTLPTVTKTSGASPTTVTGTGKTVTVFIPTVIVTTKTITEGSNGGTTKTVIISQGTTVTNDGSTNTQVSPNRPVLPTSDSASTQASNSLCWPGYYMCSAHYIGCCKIGRNCDTTHCPPTGTTITEANGVTIVESAPTAVRGPCGSGLHSCPASDYGGCCPNGYDCGLVSCTANGNGGGERAKVAPGSANAQFWAPGLMAFALVVGVGMILL